MDKNSLKKVIKPLIKECLTEILYEQGLNKLIEESIKAKSREVVKENTEEAYEAKEKQFIGLGKQNKKTSLQEAKKTLLEKVGNSGFDPFAGSVPVENDREQLNESANPDVSVLPGIKGRGVDISSLIGQNKEIWKSFSTAFKEKGKKE